MPVLSPAYKVVCYDKEGRGVALSLQKNVVKVDALIEGMSDVKPLDNTLVSLLLDPNVPLLTRPLSLPLKQESEIDQALPHEVEGLFPTPQGEIAFDRILHPYEGNKRFVTVLITTREGLEETLKPFLEKGIEAEVITATPAALALAAHALSPSIAPRGVLYIDDSQGFFIVERGGALLGSVCLKLPLQKGSVSRAIGSLTRELSTPLVQQILCFGNPEELTIPSAYELTRPPTAFGLEETEWKKFVLPFGGALGSLVGTAYGINLREKLLAPALPWKRTRRSLTLIGCSFFLALLTLFSAGQSYLAWKEDLLKEQWATTLALLGQSEETFETAYHEKTGDQELTLSYLTPADIASRAEYVQKELSKAPILFPLHPNLPRVSDLLAWIGSLDEVQGEEGRLQITSLQYSLLKRPEMEKKQEKYQVKVDMEFTTPSPKWAREFHDLLINPNPFVDPKGEVKWNVARGSYKTSFLLKDQTAYVH